VREFSGFETLFHIFLTIESVGLTFSLTFFYIFLQKPLIFTAKTDLTLSPDNAKSTSLFFGRAKDSFWFHSGVAQKRENSSPDKPPS
jgi:hypothetical protein